ncbi:MAG: DUF2726 domain-containing protein [Clostridia bacterium]|nr:DUF2726 domain-containing protein [Clostridia bacterium]
MKKNIRKKIKTRLSLLFLWLPFGLFFLLKDKSIRHRGWVGTIYFCLWAGFGLPFIGCILFNMEYAEGFVGYLFLGFLLLFIYHFACLLPDFIRNRKNKADDIAFEKIDVNISKQYSNQQTTSLPNKDINCSTRYNTKLYGVDYQTNNNKAENNNAYQKAKVLTEREKNFYETIRLIAEKYSLNVLQKMRLADIVNVSDEIPKQSRLWWSKFGQISQKHIDFALQDKTDLEIKLLIEIDDYTHQRIDRIKRDEFVDSVCEQANIPILHLYDVIGLEDKIVNILHKEKIEQEM